MTDELERQTEIKPWTGGNWEELTDQADEVFGSDLEKGSSLIGVPFCIIRATFRPGDYMNAITQNKGYYVSLDIVTAPERDFKRAIIRGRIPIEIHESMPQPEERLVFNEGGTGVYRQIVQYLEAKGRIEIGSDLPEGGAYGESKYDILPPEWTKHDGIVTSDENDDEGPVFTFDIRLLCPRGLRESSYENDYTKQGVTRYIA